MPAPSLFVAFGTISTGGGNAINPTLTLMWPTPQISSWSGYRMNSSFFLVAPKRAKTHNCQHEERKVFSCLFPIVPNGQAWAHCLWRITQPPTMPSCYFTAAQEKMQGEAAPKISRQPVPKWSPHLSGWVQATWPGQPLSPSTAVMVKLNILMTMMMVMVMVIIIKLSS